MFLIVLYLTAIILANISVAMFGPSITVFNAFVFIALDLSTRDRLHERWEHKNLWRNMLLLIAGGSVLSAVLNWNAAPIALASFGAFLLSETADALVYQALHKHPRWIKMNGSNLVSAAVDSFAFPVLAFGWPPLWGIIVGQFVAKTVGGAVWAYILTRRSAKAVMA